MPPPRSTCIGYKGAQTLYYAHQQAEKIDLGLNTFVTINFALTNIAPWEAVSAFGRLRMNHFNKWIKRPQKGKGQPCDPTYYYYFENERDDIAYEEIGEGLPHNVHVHWYLHVPPPRAHNFDGLVYEWLDYIAGDISFAGAVKIDRITKDSGLRSYAIKGATKPVAKHFGADHRQAPQGLIIGRRTGTSTNIGPSARRATDRSLGIRRKRAA